MENKKKKYLVFDTETTGLPRDWHAPVERVDNWPRLVQLAWALYEEGRPVKERNMIVRPDGFEIPEAASKVHGMDTDMATRHGWDIDIVLGFFIQDLLECDVLVAHNIAFDEKIMGAEFLRSSVGNYEIGVLNEKPRIDTMMASINFCGMGKWPKLTELHYKLFEEGFEGAHDAFADTTACARCLFGLAERKVIDLERI